MTTTNPATVDTKLGGPIRAVRYHRISRDPEGLEVGVERQDEDTQKLADDNGYTVVGTFTDNDISASTLTNKARPGYADALDMCRRGEADVILAYSNSRLTRRPLELEDLITLHQEHGTTIITSVSGQDDLSTADGRMVARIKANIDAAEAERTSERLKRAFRHRAQTGAAASGPRPFGWADDRTSLHPTEAPLLRKAIADITDGVSLLAIAREWNAAGVTTSFGNPWSHQSLRELFRSHRLDGVVTYHGEPVTDADGNPVPPQWEPLIDADTFDRLQVAIAGRAPGKAYARRGARKYLLAGILRCGICGRKMYGNARSGGRHSYKCRVSNGDGDNHTLTISGPDTDDAVSAIVVDRLREMGTMAAPAADDATERIDERLDQIRDLIAELMAAHSDGTLSGAVVFPQIAALEAERDDLAAQRRTVAATATVPDTVTADTFATVDTDRQRATVDALLEAVVVEPATGTRTPAADRLAHVWRDTA